MEEVTVRGSSDDIVVIEGAMLEEFGAWNTDESDKRFLGFSDGTLLSIHYDSEGCWRISRLWKGSADYDHEPATGPDEDYSDQVTLKGELSWVVFGHDYARRLKK